MSNNPQINKRKDYYAKNRAKLIKKTQEWRKKNYGKYILQRRANYAKNYQKLRERARDKRTELIMSLGGACVKCGYKDNILALQLDHINGDGHKDKHRFSGGISYYYYANHLDEAKAKLQVLCANCNFIKRFTNREMRTKYMRLVMRLNLF